MVRMANVTPKFQKFSVQASCFASFCYTVFTLSFEIGLGLLVAFKTWIMCLTKFHMIPSVLPILAKIGSWGLFCRAKNLKIGTRVMQYFTSDASLRDVIQLLVRLLHLREAGLEWLCQPRGGRQPVRPFPFESAHDCSRCTVAKVNNGVIDNALLHALKISFQRVACVASKSMQSGRNECGVKLLPLWRLLIVPTTLQGVQKMQKIVALYAKISKFKFVSLSYWRKPHTPTKVGECGKFLENFFIKGTH